MPDPKEFRSKDREIAKKMLREYFQKQGGKSYMKNAQQPSMSQDTKTGEYIARPQSMKKGGKVVAYGKGGKMKYKKGGFPDLTGDGKVTKADILKGRGVGDKKNERKKKRDIRKITRKALNSATSEKKRLAQDDLTRQHKVKGTKSMLDSLGSYGKKKK